MVASRAEVLCILHDERCGPEPIASVIAVCELFLNLMSKPPESFAYMAHPERREGET